MTHNTIDWHNRTYYCGNCACPRSIDDQFCAAPCGECGDDETYLASPNPFDEPIRIVWPIKVVFLDIDGVMNSCASVEEVKKIRQRCPNFPESHPQRYTPASAWKWFAPWAIEALNHITDVTGAQIVISSTWRELAIPWLRRWGVRGDIIGLTPVLDRPCNGIYVATTRGAEIAAWLDKWSRVPGTRPVSSFVILDDDAQMGELLHRLVQTDDGPSGQGLTQNHAERAIELLSQEVRSEI